MTPPALLVTGATGLLGRALAAQHTVVPLPRRAPAGGGPWWDPLGGSVHDDGRPLGAVVHLAGENVGEGRWSEARKAAIRDSRVTGTRTLVDWLRGRAQRPEVFIAASAIGFYGDRGESELDEDAGPGTGFLADTCRAWEAEADRAAEAGIRVVKLRIGIVLDPAGGALGKMLPLFRAGLGGPLGSGRQWFPWVHRDDVLGLIAHALRSPAVRGPLNAVAPGAVRQGDFARALGAALHRPAFVPAPAFALRAALGEFAQEGLLASARVVPARAAATGYTFRFPTLGPALSQLLG